MVRVAVIGAGAWGINHVRAYGRTKGAELVMVCDAAEAARERAQALAVGEAVDLPRWDFTIPEVKETIKLEPIVK